MPPLLIVLIVATVILTGALTYALFRAQEPPEG
jgi:hypothetical protein